MSFGRNSEILRSGVCVLGDTSACERYVLYERRMGKQREGRFTFHPRAARTYRDCWRGRLQEWGLMAARAYAPEDVIIHFTDGDSNEGPEAVRGHEGSLTTLSG